MRILLPLPALIALMLWLSPLPAGAHAELVESNPAAGSALAVFPSAISLSFTEAVDPDLSSVVLLSSNGVVLPPGRLSTDPNDARVLVATLPDDASHDAGIYTVVWNAYSAEDDHTSSGSFTFSVGTGVAPVQVADGERGPTPAAIAGKWLELIGAILLTGLGIFSIATRSTAVFGRSSRIDPFAVLATVGIAGALLSFRAREAAITGFGMFGAFDRGAASGLLDSTYGHAWVARTLAFLAMLALSVGIRPLQVWPAIVTALGSITIVMLAISGHAGAVERPWVAMSVDALHMLGAAVWLGGLLGLLLLVEPAVGSDDYRQLLRAQGNRFAGAIVLIVASGLVSVWWQVGGRRELTGSDYGQTLLIKGAIVAAILGIAFYNRRVLQGARARLEWTPFATGLELVLAMVVLLLSADLSQTPPANRPLPVGIAARAIEVDTTATAGDVTVRLLGILTGDPADRLTLDVDPAADLQRVIVRTALTDAETGIAIGDRFDAEPVPGTAGSYQFLAGRLGIAGDWQLGVTVRRAGMNDEVLPFAIDTSELAVRGTTFGDDRWVGVLPTWHTALALALALVMLLVGLGGLRRITGLEPLASGFLLAASLLIAGGFLVSAARSLAPITPDHDRLNPTAPDPTTLTYAGELYRLNCTACHGANGAGAGSGNLAHLHGNSADLTRSSTVEQTDGDLRYWIANGVPGTDMPAFSAALTGDEEWQLVLYIRQLQDEARAAAEAAE